MLQSSDTIDHLIAYAFHVQDTNFVFTLPADATKT